MLHRKISKLAFNSWHANAVRSMTSNNNFVIASESSTSGLVILNRPKALNSLNLEMIRKIYNHLKKWEKSKMLVIVKGAGDKSFCAGGDVRAVVEAGPTTESKNFFREEYTLNSLIANYKIPYIALIDGITMGGGVGLSVHSKYRVATERTLFAMPETAIGLFPDVGGSYFLPRLTGKLGYFLGLTGHRLKGEDVLRAGIATHFCESSRLPELETALLNSSDIEDVPDILNKYSKKNINEFSLQPHLEEINKCFSTENVESIFQKLESNGSEWALKTLKVLTKMSPTSLKVTHRELEYGAKLSLTQCLIMEFRLAVHHLENSDFKEGVRAILIDKDQNPKWKPAKLKDVTEERVQWFFKKLPDNEELKL